jgi:hypothetical protein
LGFSYLLHPGYLINLSQSEEELFGKLKSECSTCIRKFAREGCSIVEDYSEAYAEEYYRQLQDVFAKQNLIPTYSLTRVKKLLQNLKDTGMLLCLKALDPDGNCIATGYFQVTINYSCFGAEPVIASTSITGQMKPCSGKLLNTGKKEDLSFTKWVAEACTRKSTAEKHTMESE